MVMRSANAMRALSPSQPATRSSKSSTERLENPSRWIAVAFTVPPNAVLSRGRMMEHRTLERVSVKSAIPMSTSAPRK
ncbi:MAG: hypothetical protein DWI11_11240 [Planctomycetota bacterium]|nr:MAG: hypothetical protein DWI11_11240 [Planctomycetota bacterium]